jgi:hypothetical protein
MVETASHVAQGLGFGARAASHAAFTWEHRDIVNSAVCCRATIYWNFTMTVACESASVSTAVQRGRHSLTPQGICKDAAFLLSQGGP